jgi:FKBP-type peptidyl-prolyl cis-trans isomerase
MMSLLSCAVAALCAAVLPLPSPQSPAPQSPAPQQPAGGIPECKDMKKTASGLEYGVLREGRKEASPGPDDMVEVHYTGWLLDGTKFDSSRDRGEPKSFGVGQVVKGWTEGLQLMTPGAHFKFVIPAALGYGERAAGKIPPNSTLVFEVELLKVTATPKFRPAGKQQQAVGDGVKFEVVKVGTGAMCGEKDGLALRYAIWKADGTLLDCSEKQNNHRIAGTLATLPLPFLKDLAATCKVGDVLRAEVPQKLFPNAGSDTVWELELVGLSKVPEFRDLDPAKTVTTQSGLMYEVIEMGTGASPSATDTVSANYTGWLTDGTMFDSSHARGAPTEFPLNRVIKGWTEGLQLMKTGGKFLFKIPGELAYGARGSAPKIPANATLVFLVELVEVKPAKAAR